MSSLVSTISSGTQTIIGEVVGGVVMVVTVGTAFWLSRRRRRVLGVRPPQTTKLLRPPGYGLQQRLQGLNDDMDSTGLLFMGTGLVLGVCVVACIPAVMQALTGESFPPGHYWVIPAVIGTAWLFQRSLRRVLRLTEKIRHCRLGLRGEQAVAEALNHRTVVEAGYTSFHDVPGAGEWNIDHVTVGPGGVFVIETKTRSRRNATINQQEHVVTFDGRALQFPWGQDAKAAEQVRRNAEWIRNFVAGFGPKDLVVQPVMVVPGWFVEQKGKFPVLVMNATYLSRFLAGQPKRFTPDELELVLPRLDERCRTVEF